MIQHSTKGNAHLEDIFKAYPECRPSSYPAVHEFAVKCWDEDLGNTTVIAHFICVNFLHTGVITYEFSGRKYAPTD